jgi:DNA-binding transcriptional MerR regulator
MQDDFMMDELDFIIKVLQEENVNIASIPELFEKRQKEQKKDKVHCDKSTNKDSLADERSCCCCCLPSLSQSP